MNDENDDKTELSMQVLAALCVKVISEKEKITERAALSKFLKSRAAMMLFDKSTGLYLNGPDYVVNEYYSE